MEHKTLRIRHGDVLLTLTLTPPRVANPGAKLRTIILVRGEATGHAHTATGVGAAFAPSEGGGMLTLPMGGLLDHEEHGPVPLWPGIYEIRRQTTWVELARPSYVRD